MIFIIKNYNDMAKYKRGDVVSLTSGGMSMTVTGVFIDNSNDMKMNVEYDKFRLKFGGSSPASTHVHGLKETLRKRMCSLRNL